ncbi:MAG: sugar transferase, partial [Lachnospiraceae bacterium]|nr:sugar transferase [Lachnospiraceae bacterium]
IVDLQQYIDVCLDMGVSVRVIMSVFKAHGAQRYVSSVGTYPVITYHRVCLDDSSRAVKRIIDIICSLIGILVFSPIMLVTAIAIKLESKGPVIFKQKRAGLNGRIFKMYKFRSMCVDAEELKAKLQEQNEVKDGMMFKIKDDPRITKVGKFIRKTSIDELPQFFNVLFGDMSLVGTRPPTLDEVEKYERSHWRRMSIKPGITGMWQVSGRSQITDFDQIVELDTEYIDHWSIWLDFKIMIKTVFSLLQRKGAY